jgi:hypothetical protein
MAAPSTIQGPFALIACLPLTHPSLIELVHAHKPLARPSVLPQTAATKLLQRINAGLVERDATDDERRAAVRLAAEAVRQDGEGWVLSGWGKAWVSAGMGAISVSRAGGGVWRRGPDG